MPDQIRLTPLCLLLAGIVCAQAAEQGPVFEIVEENDLFADTDRHYTQGLKISYLQADNHLPRWAGNLVDALPRMGLEPEARKFGYTVGQSIFTPNNTASSALQVNDRPYAGWLYGGLILQRRGAVAGRWSSIDHLELNLGVVGEASMAEEAQKLVHEFLIENIPNGWEHQLETEPGIALKHLRAVRFSPGQEGSRSFDVIPHAGLSVGNVETSARLGGILRLGVNLPDDFGPQTIDSLMTTGGGRSAESERSRYGFYVLAGGEGRVVVFNTLLDGNTFHDSHSVDRELLVAEFKAGVVFVLNRIDLGFQYVYRTQEFTEQTSPDRFGSVYFKCRF